MFHRIKAVEPLQNYSLLIHFENKEKKQYNITQLIKELEPFKALIYVPGLFEQVKVDPGGYGISWNDEIDLACDELYCNGTLINQHGS